jgi:hypothetical protein
MPLFSLHFFCASKTWITISSWSIDTYIGILSVRHLREVNLVKLVSIGSQIYNQYYRDTMGVSTLTSTLASYYTYTEPADQSTDQVAD